MCAIMENRLNEEKIELAKQAIKRGKLSLEDIAETIGLPLAFVEELACQKTS
jgi:predicted HTH domain antitoxin